MSLSKQVKDFDDPLFSIGEKKGQANTRKPTDSRSREMTLGKVALAVVLVLLGYYLLQAQQKIDSLNTTLAASQHQLADVTQDLQSSQGKIGTLELGLTESKSKLSSQDQRIKRYKTLYSELRSEQEQHSRELEAVSIQKADQSEVNLLRGEAEKLKSQTAEIQEEVTQTRSSVAQLGETAASNRSEIELNRESISQVGLKADSTDDSLSALRQSLDREYYNFELQEKGGMMKVFEVVLNLKDVNLSRQRYDLDIWAGRKRIQRKKQYINEPIYFYVEGVKKPYEVVVTRLSKKTAVGYLSTPKQ